MVAYNSRQINLKSGQQKHSQMEIFCAKKTEITFTEATDYDKSFVNHLHSICIARRSSRSEKTLTQSDPWQVQVV